MARFGFGERVGLRLQRARGPLGLADCVGVRGAPFRRLLRRARLTGRLGRSGSPNEAPDSPVGLLALLRLLLDLGELDPEGRDLLKQAPG
eukprot:1617020-Pyramimonas_sp.AAC.1